MLQDLKQAFIANDKHTLKESFKVVKDSVGVDIRRSGLIPSCHSSIDVLEGMDLSGETQCGLFPMRNVFIWKVSLAQRDDHGEMYYTFLHEMRHVYQQLRQAQTNRLVYQASGLDQIELGFSVADGDVNYYSDPAEIDAYAFETAIKLLDSNQSINSIPWVYPRVNRWYIEGLGIEIRKKFLSKVYRRLSMGLNQ